MEAQQTKELQTKLNGEYYYFQDDGQVKVKELVYEVTPEGDRIAFTDAEGWETQLTSKDGVTYVGESRSKDDPSEKVRAQFKAAWTKDGGLVLVGSCTVEGVKHRWIVLATPKLAAKA